MTAKARRLSLLAAFAVVALPLALDLLITTDEEQVETTLAALEGALEARDPEGVLAWCTDDVKLTARLPWSAGRTTLAAALQSLLPKLGELRLSRDEARLDFADGEAPRVTLSGSGFATHPSFGGGPFRLDARIVLRRASEPDPRFLLAEVESLEAGPLLR
ncbi:MAG: nuclear transport factor 2 family protein [Planctomycetes bacterium]|nr:nuclear transport factor 2 family protein [Planctomycetota bacterium]